MTPQELAANLHAGDGFRAVVADNRPVSLAVYGEAVARGRSASASFPDLIPSVLLYEARTDDDVAFGAASRVEHLADAVCRFFNTGGTRAEFADVVGRLAPLLVGPLVLPGGYTLFETYLNADNQYEHVFVSPGSDQAVLWAEDEFVELVPWDTILERLYANGRFQSATAIERLIAKRSDPDDEADEGAADPPELPGGEDPPGA